MTPTERARETLAEQAHVMWAHWMRHLFNVCESQADGSVVIPSETAERWMRLVGTLYDELTEKERESDRTQADRMSAALSEAGLAIVPVEPTEEMIVAAGHGFANAHTRVGLKVAEKAPSKPLIVAECWQAMLRAASNQKEPADG